jgi:hypothetical protein
MATFRGYAPGGAFTSECSFENKTVLASVIYQPKTDFPPGA